MVNGHTSWFPRHKVHHTCADTRLCALSCFMRWVSFAQNGHYTQQAPFISQIRKMHNQCSHIHYRKHLPHTLDKSEIVSAASGPVCFLMIYMCTIFAMLLLDFPHALLLATSKLISYMFPINALCSSCSWLFSLCLSRVVLLRVRQNKTYLKGEIKNWVKSEYLENKKISKPKTTPYANAVTLRVLSQVLPCIW